MESASPERRQQHEAYSVPSNNFTIMHGYSEADEQDHIFALSKQLRSLHVNMAVLQRLGSNSDHYFEWD